MSSGQAASGQSLKVLVVDDAEIIREILDAVLKRLGFAVSVAADGDQAVASFRDERPDLILMDVMMPVMDGFEATRRIKALCEDRWVPVVFLSGLDEEANLVAGLDAGGDDYLAKPINFVVLEAKLRSLTRTLNMQRSLAETQRSLKENAQRLQRYHDAQEQESALAQDIMLRLMHRRGLADPRLFHWLSPAADFSGDIVAATRSGDGRLYVLLADATGHGLAAAISALPVLMVFYAMAERGKEVSTIVTELNKHLSATLPSDRFVAACLLCLDEKECSAEIWAGGMPDLLLLAQDGSIIHHFASSHLPLGIVDFGDPSMTETVRTEWQEGCQFALYSDGLLDASNPRGEPFGFSRFAAALAAAPQQVRLSGVQQALTAHLEGAPPHDDISLMLVDCSAGS